MSEQKQNGFLWLAIAAGGLFLWQKAKKPLAAIKKDVQTVTTVQRLQITKPMAGLDLKKFQVWIQFIINNPMDSPIHVSAIVGQISAHGPDPSQPGIVIGNIDRFTPIDIKPLSATNVRITATMKAFASANYLNDLITGKWKGGQTIAFNGTINANGKAWPVHEQIKL